MSFICYRSEISIVTKIVRGHKKKKHVVVKSNTLARGEKKTKKTTQDPSIGINYFVAVKSRSGKRTIGVIFYTFDVRYNRTGDDVYVKGKYFVRPGVSNDPGHECITRKRQIIIREQTITVHRNTDGVPA